MASGYEKADCGVNPSGGWGRPSRLENSLLLTVGLLGAALWIAAKIALLSSLVSWLAG